MLRLALAVVFAVSSCFTVVGFSQVRLEPKYEAGATYKTETSAQVEQTLTIAGMNVETSGDTQSVTKSTVGQRDGSGVLRVKVLLESLFVKAVVQGSEYVFDSKNPDNKGQSPLEILRDVHKIMMQQDTTMVVGKDNRIQAIETNQNLLNALPVEVQQLVKSQIDPETLKRVANQESDRLPSQAVSSGDTWVRTENMDFGAGQSMTFQTEYTYHGTMDKGGKKYDKISSKNLSVTFALKDSPLPLTLKGSDLKADSSGELLFDRELGRIVSANSTARITGDLTFVANDNELPSKLDLTIKATVSELP